MTNRYTLYPVIHVTATFMVLLAGGLTVGCNPSDPRDDEPNNDIITLKGVPLIETDSLALPINARYVTGYLIIGDLESENPLHVIDAGTGRYVGGFGHRGEGPGEILRPAGVVTYPRSDSIQIYDVGLRRITPAILQQNGTIQIAADRSVNVRAQGLLANLIGLPNGELTASGIHQGERALLRITNDGLEGKSFGSLVGGPENLPLQFRHHGYQNNIKARLDGSQIVIAYRHADRLDIHDFEQDETITLRWIDEFEPEFSTAGGRASPFLQESARYGYVDVATSSAYIFALYSGARNGDVADADFGRFVHVYTWEGELVSVYELDHPAISLEVSPASDALFTLVHYPGVAIMKYVLDH